MTQREREGGKTQAVETEGEEKVILSVGTRIAQFTPDVFEVDGTE